MMKKFYAFFALGKSLLLAGVVATTSLLFSFQLNAQDLAIDFGRTASGTQLIEDNMQLFSASFSYPGINTFRVETSKGNFNEIAIPGAFSVGMLGTPKLPATKKLMEIPFGAEVSVEVISYTVNEYKLSDYGIDQPIMPVQPSLRKDQAIDEITFEYDNKVYQKDEFIQHEIASVEILGVMRSFRIARLTIAPVSYNPVQGIIRVYNDIEVQITYTKVDESLTEYVKSSTYSPYFSVMQQAFLNNPTNREYPAHPDLVKYPVKYLIVSDRMFETDLAPFIAWKTKKGFKVITAYTDVIGTSYSAIQSWIHEQYNSGTPDDPAPSFVLLVGDTPQVPAIQGSSSQKMTDLYYASVDGDYFPEMYYGRFSARTSAQLLPYIEKTLYYEQYQFEDASYLDDVTLIAGSDGTWNPRLGQPTVHYGTQNYFNAAHGFVNINTYLTSPYSGCYSPERIAVSMINYTAHCSETSWGDPNLSQSAVNNFSNLNKYPLAVGNCCLAADFGYPECIGETWMRAPNKGAVAYIGSSPSSYWFEDFYWSVGAFPLQGNNNGYIPTYEETTWGAYDAPFVSDYITTGGIISVGNLAVTEVHLQNYPSHSSPLYYWQAYNVLGDPSLVAYHTQGDLNTVSHMPILPIGLDTYEVTALPGSYVAVSKDGILHGAALVGASGVVEVEIDPILSSGLVDIVVTKPQHIPYMTQVPAAALEGPYVVMDEYIINDDNGLAEYSESFTIDVTMKNVGGDPSANITATVVGTNDYISLTGAASAEFGPIVNGEVSTVADAFSFTVADFVPNQHNAAFIISATDGTTTWESNLIIKLHAPVLEIEEEISINDAAGNGDGILDPGETAYLVVAVANTGGSDVSNFSLMLVSSDPMLTVNESTATLTNLAAGTTAELSFSVTASDDSPIGYPVNMSMSATAGPSGVYTANQNGMVVIGLIPDFLMTNGTIETCVGNFYDSGGPGGNYSSSENFTMTFSPSMEGAVVRANFINFETESGYDFLYIYDGASTMSTQIPGSPFSGSSSPGMVQATGATGALTFKFTSDYSVTKSGWHAEISCFIDQELSANITSSPAEICAGGSAVLNAHPIGGTGTYTCTWSPAQGLNNPNAMMPIASPDETTTYTVVVDDGETTFETSYTLVVHNMPELDLGEDQLICVWHTAELDATIENGVSYLWSPGGETTASIIVDSTGVGIGSQTYSVIATDVNGCVVEAEITITFDPCTSINENKLNVYIYPNPAKDMLNIAISGNAAQFEYTLLNYQGQQLYSKAIGQYNGSGIEQIKLTGYAKGIYYLRVNTGTETRIHKVVIQ
ncbi:MAG: C25 family cysteine peptidase [Bacteroidales bacterium]|nr:C25 family cysteine peptidase [Bacteroidales bacterium]